MIKETQDRGIGMVICGFLLNFAVRAWGPGLPISRDLFAFLVIGALLGGLVLSVWGCGQIAKARGYSFAFGALGIFNLFGMVAVLLFPDRLKAHTNGAGEQTVEKPISRQGPGPDGG